VSYLTSFFSHAAAVQRAAGDLGLRAEVQLSDFSLRLAFDAGQESWAPRFLARSGGRLVYTDRLAPGVAGFAGWMPYRLRQWPIATDKSAFKRFAAEHGLATPAACRDAGSIGGPFLVKLDNSSFGEGLRGPFLAYDAEDAAQQLRTGEYYENFVVGLIAKAWCRGGECLALHLHPPSSVVGDGRASVRQLVEALPNSLGRHDWALVGRLATCSGLGSADEVPRAGQEVLVEYRYGSRYEPVSFENPNVLGRIEGTELARQFATAARICATAIPASTDDSIFTLDAIVDASGEALFLEMNCHPTVHPDLYRSVVAARLLAVPAMLE